MIPQTFFLQGLARSISFRDKLTVVYDLCNKFSLCAMKNFIIA